jgi:hypothetical protein
MGFCEVSLKATQSTLQKHLHGEKNQIKDVLIGKWHVVMQASPIRN